MDFHEREKDVTALTPAAFRAFWEPLLAKGPVEVQLFGDLSQVDEEALLAESFGALDPREAVLPLLAAPTIEPTGANRIVRTHEGDANQAAAVIAWPTAGGLDQVRQDRQLTVLAAIFSDRLLDRLRSEDGASYSPTVISNWPRDFETGGFLFGVGLVRPEDIEKFYGHARTIARELATQPIGEDEIARAARPLAESIQRSASGNEFFVNQLGGATFEPRKLTALRSILVDIELATPASLQALAQRYLTEEQSWSLVIVPEGSEVARAASGSGAGGDLIR